MTQFRATPKKRLKSFHDKPMSQKRKGRRPRFITPIGEKRLALFRALARIFNWFRPTTRFLIGFFALAILTTLLLARTRALMPAAETYREGDIVNADVFSPADITADDSAATERRREEARRLTPSVWNHDRTMVETAIRSFRSSWLTLKQQAESREEGQRQSNTNTTAPELAWPGEGADKSAIARAIAAKNFDVRAFEALTQVLREAGAVFIFEESDAPDANGPVRVVDTLNGNQVNLNQTQGRFISLPAARESLKSRILGLNNWKLAEREALASAIVPLLKSNVVHNRPATQAGRDAAADAVQPVTVVLKRNQTIARAGDTVTHEILAQFSALRQYSQSERRPQHLIGLFLISCGLYFAAWRFTEYRSTITALPLSHARAYTLVSLSVVVQLVLMRAGFFVAESIASHSMRAPMNDVMIWSFAVPFAAAALLVATLVDTQLALVTAVLTAIFAGLLAPAGTLMACFSLVSSSSAIYGFGRYSERQSVTQAGLIAGIMNIVLAIAVMLAAQQPLTLNAILLAAACGLAGGLLTAIFTAGGLPVNESLFGILTDVKLLELSNADLPVLGQLALRAPGTNQHSHAVGQLAEEACRAIGANPLLVRIGALYHDIGKLAAPEYFVENQSGENPHDRLRPTQSARIITSHVTYGLKLAHEINLPRQIAEFIPQHHGTRTLHFFLRKAQAQAADGEVVDEAEFRYPGPKPQSKEAAVMMLADSCEAAARSLARPDPCNIRTIVSRIFDAIVSDGQLDECNLTMRELTKLRESITSSLIAIYHARIDYPGFNPPSLGGEEPALMRPEIDSEERGIGYKPSEVPISEGGEVEDEALTSRGNS
jgi:putative nucleotidyltransferase with HDIG domain